MCLNGQCSGLRKPSGHLDRFSAPLSCLSIRYSIERSANRNRSTSKFNQRRRYPDRRRKAAKGLQLGLVKEKTVLLFISLDQRSRCSWRTVFRFCPEKHPNPTSKDFQERQEIGVSFTRRRFPGPKEKYPAPVKPQCEIHNDCKVVKGWVVEHQPSSKAPSMVRTSSHLASEQVQVPVPGDIPIECECRICEQ